MFWLQSLVLTWWSIAAAEELPSVQVEVSTDLDRVYVDQLVRVHVDVLVRRLRTDDHWLREDPIPRDDPPKLTIPWLNGTPWLQPVRDPVELLRARLGKPAAGFRINDLFQEELAGPFLPLIRRRQLPVPFDRSEVALPDGTLAYRYRLTLPFRTTRPGTTVPVTVELEGSVYVALRLIGDRRVELIGASVQARSNRFSLHIQPLPLRGRPRYFTGAVGRFRIRAEVDHKRVRLGDPIRLTIEITGEGLLERIAPPRLSMQPGWQLFRVHDEPISSEVSGNSRRFVYRIRPTSTRLEAIPPVLWSFFDPVLGRYQTVATEAIPIEVRPVQVVRLEEEPARAGVAERDGPLAQLHGVRTGSILLRDHRPLIASLRAQLSILILPAVLVLAWYGGAYAVRRWASSPRVRRRECRRRVLRTLDQLTDAPPQEVAARLPELIAELLSDGEHLPEGRRTAPELMALLDVVVVDAGLRRRVAEVLGDCEQARFAARQPDRKEVARWQAAVRELADYLADNPPRLLTAVLLLAATVPLLGRDPSLPAQRREQLATMAYRAWQQAKTDNGELASGSSGYRLAAARYRLLLETGLRNGYVLYNIGTCYLMAEDMPQALRYYLWARQYIPRDPWLNENLAAVRSRLAAVAAAGTETIELEDGDPEVAPVLSGREYQAGWLTLWAFGWSAFFLASGIGCARRAKLFAGAILVAAACAAAFQIVREWDRVRRPTAVVLTQTVPRTGPGLSYEALDEPRRLAAGMVARQTRSIAGWVELELADGTKAWLPSRDVGVIEPAFRI